MNSQYIVGLDIGTSSTGYAMTDLNGKLLKHHKRSTFGTVCFETAQTAENRRIARSTRRRLDRREQRIDFLQSLLADDIGEADENFFYLLNESFLQEEDRKYPHLYGTLPPFLFVDESLRVIPDAKTHHCDAPTIYHVRHALATLPKQADIRYVYLALHHIIKYRGHFLLEGEKLQDAGDDIIYTLEYLLDYLTNPEGLSLPFALGDNAGQNLYDLLTKAHLKRKEICDHVIALLHPKQKTGIKSAEAFAQLLIGQSITTKNLLNTEIAGFQKVNFSDELFDEEVFLDAAGEHSDFFEAALKVYRWHIFAALSKDGQSLSQVMIERYEQHKKDLQKLKSWIKSFVPDEYNAMFRDSDNKTGYSAYVGHQSQPRKSVKEPFARCSQVDFYKKLKDLFTQSNLSAQACQAAQPMLDAMQDENGFLPLLRISYNGVFPNQLQEAELRMILDNQGTYYPSLQENKEKIISLCTFRLPYYVGPLNITSPFQKWLVRKTDIPVRPWNFNDVVDKAATADGFVLNLTNKCTYLPSEDVLPLHSLLYEEYLVLDELNCVRINGKALTDAELKRRILDEVFASHKRVTHRLLREWLEHHSLYHNPEISGTHEEDAFASSLRTRFDLEKHGFSLEEVNIPMLEELVRWSTVFENRGILREKINQKYPQLSKNQIDFLCRKRYTGWGRFSRMLLDGIQGELNHQPATVIEIMRATPSHFMQVMHHKKYGIQTAADAFNQENYGMRSGEISYDEVRQLQGSPALKRSIWQAVRIVRELTEIQGCPPKAIYLENTREDEPRRKGKRTTPRLEAIQKAYGAHPEDVTQKCREDLEKCKRLNMPLDDRQYLYFIQHGKCLYSERPLDFDCLSETCEIDHILPQSYIKDDSLENRALVLKGENQRKRDSLLLDEDIIRKRKNFWLLLHKNGLMGSKKLRNLTRHAVEPNEMVGFINRQLVETSQIIKHVTNLFRQHYPDTLVRGINARLTHALRDQYGLLKLRELNDAHHAFDALLTCTIGIFADRYLPWLSDDSIAGSRARALWLKNNAQNKYGILLGAFNRDQVDDETGEVLRKAQADISYLKKAWMYKDCFFVYRKFENHGEFYNQTRYPAGSAKACVPLRKDYPIERYGGFGSVNAAYMAIVLVRKGKKQTARLVNVPVYLAQAYDHAPKQIMQAYLQAGDPKIQNVEILHKRILLNQKIEYEGSELLWRSCTETRNARQLFLPQHAVQTLYIMLQNMEKVSEVLTEEVLDEMICLLLEKLDQLYPVFAQETRNIKEKMERVKSLCIREKALFIRETLKIMTVSSKYAAYHAALPTLEIRGEAGRIQKKSYDLSKVVLVDQSITGLRERRHRLCLDSEPSLSKAPAK